jgi:short-subunit dehydrogenase
VSDVADGELLNCVKASSGLGRATASALAQRGFHVILAGRSLERLEVVRAEIEAQSSSASCQALPVDLSSVPSILCFTQTVKELFESHDAPGTLQLLVNNAGKVSKPLWSLLRLFVFTSTNCKTYV